MIRLSTFLLVVLWGTLACAGPFQGTKVVNTDNGIPLQTVSTVCQMIDARFFVCKDSGGCDAAGHSAGDIHGTNFSFAVNMFDPSSDEVASWHFELPDNLTGTTAEVTFIWISDNAACSNGADDDVCWTVDGDSFADDVAFETATLGGTLAAVTDKCAADGDILRAGPVTFTHSMLPGQTGVLLIGRDVDGGNCAGTGDDDYGQDANLINVRFCYEVNNVFSGE